jgi:hypothetical protein
MRVLQINQHENPTQGIANKLAKELLKYEGITN